MKVLIISHNPLCTYNGMGKTLASLFSAFRKEELCQLYIYPSYPDLDLCSSYYRITDKDVLRGLVHFEEPGAVVEKAIISPKQTPFESVQDENLYHNARNKTPVRRLARDEIWRLSHWYGKHLRSWLDQEAPDIVFAAPGSACFLYDIAMKIAQDRRIPIVAYLCDEFYFVQPAKQLSGKLQQLLLKRKIEAFLAKTTLLVTISEELKSVYSEYFRVPCQILMTGSTMQMIETDASNHTANHLSYFGNVRSERYRTLRIIGDALDQLGKERGFRYYLDIYSFESDPKILRILTESESIRMHGFLQGREFQETFCAAELLLHVESFDPQMVDKVKHSVSTKIADSLASGIPLLAYGPAGLSSIEHLRRNSCAFVCTETEQLRETLDTAMNDLEARKEVSDRARITAATFHDPAINSKQLYDSLIRIGGDLS